MTDLQQLLDQHDNTPVPQVGDVIDGTVIAVATNEVHVDVNGIATGIAGG